MNGVTFPPSALMPRVITVVAEIPSRSKSPNTTMCLWPLTASSRASTTSFIPSISYGFRQSRSSDGSMKSLAAWGVSIPRETITDATNRGSPSSRAIRAACSLACLSGMPPLSLNCADISCLVYGRFRFSRPFSHNK